VTPIVDPLAGPPKLLAHDGAARHATPGSLEAFQLALRIGADGVHTRAWTDPGGQVLVGRPPRRFRRGTPAVGLEELSAVVDGVRTTVALGVEDRATAAEVLRWARVRGAVERLWVCSTDPALLAELRSESMAAKLFHVGDPASAERGPEHHVAALRESGVDGLVVDEERVGAGFVALAHRFGRMVVAAGADYERTARRAIGNGVDAVTGADVEALAAARGEEAGPPR
jgi:glycerophosphoryl diester phosphodiesterase